MRKLLFLSTAAMLCFAACNKSSQTTTAAAATTEESDGSLCGVFAVSDSTQVVFSRGNLQYRASDKTWRFAEEQYQFLGEANSKISKNNKGYIDLFGWGTSGKQGKMPYANTLDAKDYANDTIAGTDLDWGVNPISNGKGRKWRTLTHDEWSYLLDHSQYAQANVCNTNGLLLFPEKAAIPQDIEFKVGNGSWLVNTYDQQQWTKLQAAGAVFLPAAGSRDPFQTTILADTTEGHYWASTLHGRGLYGATQADSFDFDGAFVRWAHATHHTDDNSFRTPENGLSVRLVSDHN